MGRRRGKQVSFDAMIKFFFQSYGIVTKKDLERLEARLERIERMLEGMGRSTRRRAASAAGTAVTASDQVLEVIGRSAQGVGIAQIQSQTGFGEKKLRNILFRLHKMGKIRRIRRGVYVAESTS